MTISSTINRKEYTGNGATTAFATTFPFLLSADLKVYQEGVLKTITTHYTVSGGSGSTGTVTFVTAPATGDDIVILRDPAITQGLDLVENDPLPAEELEKAYDRLTMISQRLADRIGRSFVLSDSDVSGAATIIPSPAAFNVVGWNSDGTALQNYEASDFATALTYADRRVETFTGDGATQDFTLAETPAVVANTDVDIAGVSQIPGTDYTLLADGLTIHFATAPGNGLSICVKYGQAVAQSRDDANTVYYAPEGTGAVSSSVQAKLREWVDFENDFGAVNVIGTSNTAAWNAAMAAMNASGVRILRIRGGYYDFDTQPNPITTSGITIIADPNTYFYRNYVPASATDAFLDVRGTAVHIENVAILAKLGITGVAIASRHPNNSSYAPDYGVLKNVRVYGSASAYWSKCLHLDGTLRASGAVGIRDWRIDNCNFWDVESGGKHIHLEEAVATSIVGGGFYQGSAPGTGLAHVSGALGHLSQKVIFSDGLWSGTIEVDYTDHCGVAGTLDTSITIASTASNVLCLAAGDYTVSNAGTTSQTLPAGLTLDRSALTSFTVASNATGGTNAAGIGFNTTVLSDVTNSYSANKTGVNTQGASFTLAQLYHYNATQGTFNGASVVTNQYGFIAGASLTGATNNYGFYGNIAAGSNRYNFYAAGTAQNYTAGEWGIGIAPSATSQMTLAAGTTAKSPLRITHGAAPTSPVDGDIWTTTAGLFVRINGVTKTVTLV